MASQKISASASLHLSSCHTGALEISQNSPKPVEKEFRTEGVGTGHISLTELNM